MRNLWCHLATMLLHSCLASADTLLATHYSGFVYTLAYTPPSSTSNQHANLTIKSSINTCGKKPSWLTLDSASKAVYCMDEDSSGHNVLASFSITDSGAISLRASASTTGGSVHGALYGGSGNKGYFATVEYDLSTLSTYKLPLTSTSKVVQKQKFTLASPGPVSKRQDKAHPHSVLIDPTGEYLVVPDLGADLIRIFQINASNGMLTDCPSVSTTPGDGPRHGAWWVGGTGAVKVSALYTINELSKSVTAWTANYSSSGCFALDKIGTVSTTVPGKTSTGSSSAGEVHVAGDYLYASNRNDRTFGSHQDSLITYKINQNGSLSLLEATNAHGWYARTFSINSAGDLLAVGGQASSTVSIISRDPSTGRLGDLLASLQVGELGTDGGWDGLSSVVWAK